MDNVFLGSIIGMVITQAFLDKKINTEARLHTCNALKQYYKPEIFPPETYSLCLELGAEKTVELYKLKLQSKMTDSHS
jgi:hypothetical protein